MQGLKWEKWQVEKNKEKCHLNSLIAEKSRVKTQKEEITMQTKKTAESAFFLNIEHIKQFKSTSMYKYKQKMKANIREKIAWA